MQRTHTMRMQNWRKMKDEAVTIMTVQLAQNTSPSA
jgi:hypothetical protein